MHGDPLQIDSRASGRPRRGDLLDHADWLHCLARSPVFDDGEIDDAVQATRLAALGTRDRVLNHPRAWLAAGGDLGELEIDLAPPTRVCRRVVDAAGQPLADLTSRWAATTDTA